MFAIRPAARGGPIDVAPVAPSPLSANQLSFWAYRDRDASVAVDYQASDGTWRPYVTLSVPRGALLHRPDGTLFASGDSVEITLSLDTTALALELEPTGLGFDPLVPAQLKIWYSAAGPDLDGDGSVNSVDAYIEEVLLGLWTREQLTDPWSALSAIKTASAKVLSADLAHFSGYEVAW
ncbi:MAG: hypothetical protein HY560_12990 [Gemmatimonadetes bacterium]|nr:hypothetical protein [Gemmatimonadota bacterium]